MRNLLLAGLTTAGLSLLAPTAHAKPEYAKKENKACGYCHVKPNGGGARNPRGVYYEMHNLSFAGYDEAKVMGAQAVLPKKSGPPAFKLGWKIEVPAGSKRVAAADVAGDKTPRLLLLDEAGSLTVNKIVEGKLEKEETLELGKAGASFVTGSFAKDKPAMIAVPGAVYIREGGKFVKKAAPALAEVTGSVRFTTGVENFFTFTGAGAPESFGVDPAVAQPLISGSEMVSPDQGGGVYADVVVRPTPELLGILPIPEEGKKVGVLGMFDPRGEKKVYVWVPWVEKNGETTLRVIDSMFVGGTDKVVWTSPKLEGKVLDVATAVNPKDPKQTALVVLLATGEGGKGRTVEFWALD
jgi:hypothetical protein